MAETDTFTSGIVVGLLAGIPIGVCLCWIFTQFFVTQHSTGDSKSVSNLEEWEVERDKKGLPLRVKVHREVEAGG